ncbi:MAG TPA: tail fiber domain-containing protein [Niabella sp.]|nr:tail fiber domain-containing protein [Niabella sp.]HQW15137.1 tail fiber domain-containing protein [Niabella sp.]HQX20396.1 tail fiber domain-containing protein [Niabella sp.]HRB08499.1 tail fiber domain-containing protein [Niabella sp.]HRB37245.1 tail fiber domain-containing protein [Niabella sp.]
MLSKKIYSIRIFQLTVILFSASLLNAQTIPEQSLKKEVAKIENATEKIAKLEPKTFKYNTKDYKFLKLQEGQQYGYLVEDVEAVLPQLVTTKIVQERYGKNAYRNKKIKVIDESALISILVASVKEQQQEIESLKQRLVEVNSVTSL